MRHEEIRTLLPRYAGGLLSMADSEAVREHLASGCADCLDVLYRMPVGMPRTPPPEPQHGGFAFEGAIPPPAGPASGSTTSWVPRVVAVVLAATLVAWAITLWGGR